MLMIDIGDRGVGDLLRQEREVKKALANTIKLTIISQAPSRTGRLPMFPLPKGSAGWYLYRLFDITIDEYLAIDRRNLIDYFPGKSGAGDHFPLGEAKQRAKAMLPSLRGRNVLFMGRGVAGAFGKTNYLVANRMVSRPMMVWYTEHDEGYNFAIFPHTSRVNRFWNDKENAKMAARFLMSTYVHAFYKKELNGKPTGDPA